MLAQSGLRGLEPSMNLFTLRELIRQVRTVRYFLDFEDRIGRAHDEGSSESRSRRKDSKNECGVEQSPEYTKQFAQSEL